MRKLTGIKTHERIAALEYIVRNTLWMARRYAHGRQSYAVGTYNDAARVALRLGVAVDPTDGSVFALDGTQDGEGSPEMSGLSQAEFDEVAASLNAAKITPHPNRFTPAGRRALSDAQTGTRERDDEGRTGQ